MRKILSQNMLIIKENLELIL